MPQIQRPKPEDINDTYRAGYITAAEKNAKMRRLAKDNLEDILTDSGMSWMMEAYWKQSLKHVQENWDHLVQIATTTDPTESSAKNLSNIAKAMWDQVGI